MPVRTGICDKGGAFTGVSSDAYFFAPVEWAVNKGIISGIGDGLSGQDDTRTRGQIHELNKQMFVNKMLNRY